MVYKEIYGNLIDLANEGNFDFIGHGVNCFCTMGAGIAPHMARNYDCNNPAFYSFEAKKYEGNKSKLGKWQIRQGGTLVRNENPLMVANIYSQYHYASRPGLIQLDYDALERALKSIGDTFLAEDKPLHFGLPLIGCGLAGGDWSIVSEMIQENLDGHKITIVKLPPIVR